MSPCGVWMIPVLPYRAPSRPFPLGDDGRRVMVSKPNELRSPGSCGETPVGLLERTAVSWRLVMPFTLGEAMNRGVGLFRSRRIPVNACRSNPVAVFGTTPLGNPSLFRVHLSTNIQGMFRPGTFTLR